MMTPAAETAATTTRTPAGRSACDFVCTPRVYVATTVASAAGKTTASFVSRPTDFNLRLQYTIAETIATFKHQSPINHCVRVSRESDSVHKRNANGV